MEELDKHEACHGEVDGHVECAGGELGQEGKSLVEPVIHSQPFKISQYDIFILVGRFYLKAQGREVEKASASIR